MTESKKSFISIERNKNWFGKARSKTVIVDGDQIGEINDGEKKNFPIPPGLHTVLVKTGKIETKPLAVNIELGETVYIEYINKSHLNITGCCISGLVVFAATIVLEYFKIPFIFAFLIATFVMTGIYKKLWNKNILPPIVVIDEYMNPLREND